MTDHHNDNCPTCLRWSDDTACKYAAVCSYANSYIPVSTPFDSIPAFDPHTPENQRLLDELTQLVVDLEAIYARWPTLRAKILKLRTLLKD